MLKIRTWVPSSVKKGSEVPFLTASPKGKPLPLRRDEGCSIATLVKTFLYLRKSDTERCPLVCRLLSRPGTNHLRALPAKLQFIALPAHSPNRVISTERSERRNPEERRNDAENGLQKAVLHIRVLPALSDYDRGPGSLGKLEMIHLRCVPIPSEP